MGSTSGGTRAPRVRTLATAVPDDPQKQKPWNIRNVSVSGAFIETTSGIPVGTEFDAALVFGAMVVHIRAKVVRVQEPSWELPAGIGIEFTNFLGDAETFLKSYIDATANAVESSQDP